MKQSNAPNSTEFKPAIIPISTETNGTARRRSIVAAESNFPYKEIESFSIPAPIAKSAKTSEADPKLLNKPLIKVGNVQPIVLKQSPKRVAMMSGFVTIVLRRAKNVWFLALAA